MYYRDTTLIYQFRIVLNSITPEIWRRVQVRETYSYWDLHVAIQDAMGWEDYHLHRFEVINPVTGLQTKIGIPRTNLRWSEDILPGWQEKIALYFSLNNREARYLYDYLGDNWDHIITLEQILNQEDGTKYPRCSDGMRACPPEDCGGVKGYYRLLEIIRNADREQDRKKWKVGGRKYEPEQFDSRKVHFDDPARRFDLSFR